MNIKKEVRNLRKRIGLSQERLANQMDISATTIRNWEKGRTQPSVSQWLYIQKLVEVVEKELNGTAEKKKGGKRK